MAQSHMRRNRIAEEWMSYREQVLPKDASSIQLIETRRAFFAGALACKHVILRDISSGDETTAEDLSIMEDLEAEFSDLAKRAAQGLI